MNSMSKPSLVCVGPTGIGYFLAVEQLPERDAGTYASSAGAMVICDAAIVACEVASTGIEAALITNNLGKQMESAALRQHLLACGVDLQEDKSVARRLPFDAILLEQSTGSRTFITTGFFPKRAHISSWLSILFGGDGPDGRKAYLYVDAELRSPPRLEAVAALAALVSEPELTLVNLGDVFDLADIISGVKDVTWPESTVFQVSYKSESLAGPDAFTALHGAHPIIVTSGANGAFLVVDGVAHHVPCQPVDNSLTVGAGAVFAGSLLADLIA